MRLGLRKGAATRLARAWVRTSPWCAVNRRVMIGHPASLHRGVRSSNHDRGKGSKRWLGRTECWTRTIKTSLRLAWQISIGFGARLGAHAAMWFLEDDSAHFHCPDHDPANRSCFPARQKPLAALKQRTALVHLLTNAPRLLNILRSFIKSVYD
jgi:hypothetical protein